VRGRAAAIALVVTGCSDFRVCPPVDEARLTALPAALSATGLDGDDVIAFAPRFSLWIDGATKRRWLRLPPGTRIDTRDPDAWQFPPGTRLWKELVRDGVRVETRMLERTAGGAWLAVAYVWEPAAGDAFMRPDGVVDAGGTRHDVPAADQCGGCHGGTRSGVLGLSAIQLPTEQLDALVARGLLTDPPPGPIELPGDATEQAALGWLHANCGHCHRPDRPPAPSERCYDPRRAFDLSLRVGDLGAVETTGVYRTAIGDVIEPGEPGASRLLDRIERGAMPPLGHDDVDRDGAALVRRWIERLAR